MITFPPAKINLGLQVVRMRSDGYRDIRTVFLPIPLRDALEVVVDPVLPPGELVMTTSGLPIPGDPQQDLCLRAARLLRGDSSWPGLRVHLHKAIPIGAGLGGGSSDGAHMLRSLNELLRSGRTEEQLHEAAATLGSDCAFFLRDEPCYATGRGEVLTPIKLDLRGWWLLLLHPGVHVSTAEAYANTPVHAPRADLAEVLTSRTPDRWTGLVENVMEPYVMKAYPAVAEAKQRVLEVGAAYAAMSGSGSCVFGLFKQRPVLPELPQGHMAWCLPL